MSIVGIAAEYNPFHAGHLYHIEKTRELVGDASVIVCVMSGDFVQRGEAAVYSKFARAEAACRCGADLVIELPLPWCLASAEGFARGAVSLLDRLGCSYICFGSEAGEIEPLQRLAEELLKPDFQERVRKLMEEEPSSSYASARQRIAAESCGGSAVILQSPNNILAVEYLKALAETGSACRPLTVRRFGSAHDGAGGALPSASELRAMLARGTSTGSMIPAAASDVFTKEERLGRRPDDTLLETAILSRLRWLDEAAFDALPDASDGLGRRLYRAVREEGSLGAIMDACKTKRYAMSRVRRMILSGALGLRSGMCAAPPPYARVLAANAAGCELLRRRSGEDGVPIVTKPASVRKAGNMAAEIFELGAKAHDLYVLAYPNPEERRGGEDWRTGPTIL